MLVWEWGLAGVVQMTDMRKVRGEVPSERFGHGMATAGGNIYIFGGIFDDRFFLYSPGLCTFFSVGVGAMINSNVPPKVRQAFGFVGEGDLLYIFGGMTLSEAGK